MRNVLSLLTLTTLVTACAPQALNNNTTLPNNNNSAALNNNQLSPLGKLQFRPISAANLPLAQQNAQASRSANLAPQAAKTAGAEMAVGVASVDSTSPVAPQTNSSKIYSGNQNGFYYYGSGYYFGEDGASLVALNEAELPGADHSYKKLISDIVAPVLKDWASDARLVSMNANTDRSGKITTSASTASITSSDAKIAIAPFPGGYIGPQDGWNLTYVSKSLRETLQFTANDLKTIVIRSRYAPMELNSEDVKIDTTEAIASLTKAIEDKESVSAEEKSGLDYFFNRSFKDGLAWMPGTENSNQYEVFYKIPEKAKWNINLQKIMGKTVWQLNFSEQMVYAANIRSEVSSAASSSSSPVVSQDPGYYDNQYGGGMVDANSGTVIRFSRPYRFYYNRK
jgi:hypothetical protein